MLIKQTKITMGLLVPFLISQKYLENLFITGSMFLLSPNFGNIYQLSVKTIILNMPY